MRVYRITPLEKKSISIAYEMYRDNADNSTSWFNITDNYRWGQGFINEDMDVNLPYKDNKSAVCDPSAGWGAELDDQVACWFEFSDDITEEEQEEIKKKFRKDNYMIMKNAGYDEYYLLRHDGFSDEEEEFEVDEDASMRSIANAFVKFNMSRKTSRVILNRFIGLIS